MLNSRERDTTQHINHPTLESDCWQSASLSIYHRRRWDRDTRWEKLLTLLSNWTRHDSAGSRAAQVKTQRVRDTSMCVISRVCSVQPGLNLSGTRSADMGLRLHRCPSENTKVIPPTPTPPPLSHPFPEDCQILKPALPKVTQETPRLHNGKQR